MSIPNLFYKILHSPCVIKGLLCIYTYKYIQGNFLKGKYKYLKICM